MTRRICVDRQNECDLFEHALVGGAAQRILLVQAPAGMGKTSLLAEFAHRTAYERDCACVPIDLKGHTTGIEEVISRACSRLGWKHFEHLRATVAGLIKISDNVLIGQAQIRIALDAQTLEEQRARHTQITDAFFMDLAVLPYRRVVFLFDTFEQANETVADWMGTAFLSRVSTVAKIIVAVSGRRVPEITLEWETCCHAIHLQPLLADDWYEYARLVNVSLPAEIVKAFHFRFDGHPAEMVNTLGMFVKWSY